MRAARWGAYVPGIVYVRGYDRLPSRPLGDAPRRAHAAQGLPARGALRSIARPLRTQVFSGNQVERERGDGIEFADLRLFVAGDLVRRVNWRASARRQELWVNDYHPERNSDVILFLDSFAEARRGDASTLDQALRATAALAARYLRESRPRRSRQLRRTVNWLLPATGVLKAVPDRRRRPRQPHRPQLRLAELDVVPRRTLPPHALVLAVSLLDEQATSALLDLRARGFDRRCDRGLAAGVRRSGPE